jgi:prolyl-tRNA synthetase
VGHVFALGDLYSKAMGATLSRRQGQIAGCRDGLLRDRHHRVVAAAIEQNHDAKGIIWPTRWRRSPWPSRLWATTAARPSRRADRLHDELEAAGVEVLLDDRGERPGVMFADMELIGIPHGLPSATGA